MHRYTSTFRATFVPVLVVTALGVGGCSKPDDATKAAAASGTSAVQSAVPEAPPPPPTEDAAAWTPEALDELLAPIALYPDVILAQVLAAATNTQEVLDAGNWLLDNQSLQGDALTKAAADADFSPSLQALVHFPTVVDMMCRELDWTRQVGDAFSADQGAVLASVQRLRAQAAAAGNLKSSPEMTVDKSQQNDKEVITIQNPNPQVVYVPQYNPTQVYAAPATTTTTSSGISTSDAVVGGLLAFGAGIAVASLFDNDDHHHNNNYYYPNWGYGGVYYGGRPYYPHNTFVYAPRYPGYRPSPYYRPPANYQNRYNNNNYYKKNNVNVNVNNNAYFNRFDKNQNRLPSYQARSPVGSPAARANYKGQTTYNGANKPRTAATAAQRPANIAARPAATGAGQGSGAYKGATQYKGMQTTQRPASGAYQRPSSGADRGYPKTTGNRPDISSATQNRGGSFSGAGRNQGAADRAASQRGRASMKAAPRPSSSAHKARAGSGSANRARRH